MSSDRAGISSLSLGRELKSRSLSSLLLLLSYSVVTSSYRAMVDFCKPVWVRRVEAKDSVWRGDTYSRAGARNSR
ncbi:hypothetical protein CROQUDRAFT_89189 [Cronartium quercuum f. sp. fusiforme G11]|uniref:Uncharacterized protein n=1 Tax=Cronartium quercuum f. sp. fusiforme G11 TaxID=708437 RepID=A0A9P6TEC5_9BASI|nr:hypothetical protein CROQUDRAFT_89189 [Cronartium quercuum f. sp. fusiforme G11]